MSLLTRSTPSPVSLVPGLRDLRKERGLDLRQAARALGCSRSHLSEVERGLKRPSRILLLRVEEFFGLQGLAPSRVVNRSPGRAQLRSRGGEVRSRFRTRRRPRMTQPLRVEFSMVGYHEVGRQRLAELNARSRPPIFWKAVKTLPRKMNCPEQGALLAMLLPDGEPHELHPRDVGFPLPVIEPPHHWWLAVLADWEGWLFAAFGQLEISPRPGATRRLDFLLGAARRDVRGLVVVEVDGPLHRGRGRLDRARAEEIGLPCVRFKDHEVWLPDFRDRMFRAAIDALASKRSNG